MTTSQFEKIISFSCLNSFPETQKILGETKVDPIPNGMHP